MFSFLATLLLFESYYFLPFHIASPVIVVHTASITNRWF